MTHMFTNPLATSVKSGEKAVVIGAGRSGMAAVRLLISRGVQTTLLEKDSARVYDDFREEVEPQGVTILCGEHGAEHFVGVDYIISSPGIRIADIIPLVQVDAQGKRPEILSEMELAWRHVQGEPIVAVTGTSGKTTTVSLAAAMLEAQGKLVFLGGNIGTPLSEYVLEVQKTGLKADALVLEVSSFQLQGCSSFRPHVAVLMNISENHLDYHEDMQEYIDAKMQLFARQQDNDMAVIHASLADVVAKYALKAQKLFFEKDAQNFPEKQLFGAHNAVNIEAAWLAVKQLGVSLENARKAVAAFEPLPHRLEKVRVLRDVLYVNDSKCTTVDAMRVALQSFDAPILLLCGGKFKGGDLPSLVPLLQKNVKAVVGFGASEKYFSEAWKDIVPMTWHTSLAEAVHYAQSQAQEGDVVLMAPATSSFDLYSSYIKRGEDFQVIVGALE